GERGTGAVDSQGRIVATLGDYAAVRRLVEPLVSAGVGSTVPATVREVVAAVASHDGEVTTAQLAADLQLDTSAAWRRVQHALAGGHIENPADRPPRPGPPRPRGPPPAGAVGAPPGRLP